MKKTSGIRMTLDTSRTKLRYKGNRDSPSQLKHNSHLTKYEDKNIFKLSWFQK